jgi:capsular polysaccharide biosynthesis protein
MNTKNINNENNDEVNLIFLFEFIVRNIKFIAIFSLFSAFLSVFVALSIENTYKSQALLSVSSSSETDKASLSSSYGGLASLAGISIASTSSDRASLAMSIIQSREFLRHLIEFEGVLSNLVAAKSYNSKNGKITYHADLYDVQKDEWIREVSFPKTIKPSFLEAHRYYSEIIEVSRDKTTGFINISVEHISPIFAKEFLQLVISELNLLAKANDQKESIEALEFLNAQAVKINQLGVKESINLLIESNLKTKMLSNIRDDYLLRTIDKPFVPEVKSSPNRPLICILITSFGFIVSLLIVFIRQIFFKKA